VTSVRIPVRRFQDGHLPAVCAVSGIPAAGIFAVRSIRPDGTRSVAGAVPLHQQVARNLRLAYAAVIFMVVMTLLIGITGVVLTNAGVVCVALLAGLACAALRRWTTMQMPLAVHVEDEIELRNVHESFVQAISAPPSKCSGCPSSSGCSVTEMDACAGADAADA
jgi:hypothetical protein